MLLHGLVAALLGVAARPPLPVDPEGDPLALKDPFLELSGEELRTKWSLNANVEPAEPGDAELLSTPRQADSTLAARLSALDALRETVYVDVRLVGFDGDGEHELRMSEEVLQRLLTAASHEEAQHVVNPRPSAPHALPVRRRILYKVTKAQPALATRVARAVELHAGERGCALERTRVLQTFPKRPQNTFQDLRSPVLPTCNLLSLIIATGTSSTSRRRRRSGSSIPRCRKRLAPSRRESRRSSRATQSILLMVRSRFSQRHSSHG